MEEVGEHFIYWIGKWWQRRKDLLYVGIMPDFGPLPSPFMNNSLDTAYALLVVTFTSDLFVN